MGYIYLEAYDGNVKEVITKIWFIHSFSDLWSGLMIDKSLFAYIRIQDNIWMICNLVWLEFEWNIGIVVSMQVIHLSNQEVRTNANLGWLTSAVNNIYARLNPTGLNTFKLSDGLHI